MQDYESMFIFNAEMDDGQIEDGLKKIEQNIKKQGGEVIAAQNWGRRKLAYPIKKQPRGNYVLVQFKAPSPAIGILEQQYLITEPILRFMTVALEPEQVGQKVEASVPKEE